MYSTDRGIEELAQRCGDESFSMIWLTERMRLFVDLHPDFEAGIDTFATWLARDDEFD